MVTNSNRSTRSEQTEQSQLSYSSETVTVALIVTKLINPTKGKHQSDHSNDLQSFRKRTQIPMPIQNAAVQRAHV
jgi:hypothetical protein